MKLFLIFFIIFGCHCVHAQENAVTTAAPFLELDARQLPSDLAGRFAENHLAEIADRLEIGGDRLSSPADSGDEKFQNNAKSLRRLALKDLEKIVAKPDYGKIQAKENLKTLRSDDSTSNTRERFHWTPAIKESLYFLGIQHGFRLFQKKTQRELDGKFFRDWGHTVKNLRGWGDGDLFFINYFGHPMQGALTGRIFLNNSDKSKKLEFGKSKEYWTSRLKTMAWSAIWSAQFELGPISEASIGNVGVHDDRGPSAMAWVDLVVTPTAGTGVLIGEDLIDKYFLKNWLEKKTASRTRRKVYRTFFTPFQGFSNILAGRVPWHRDNR